MTTRAAHARRAGNTVLAAAIAASLTLTACSSDKGTESRTDPSASGATAAPEPPEGTDESTVGTDTAAPGDPDAEETGAADAEADSDVYAGWEEVELPQRGPTVPGTDLEGAKSAAEGILAAYFGGLVHGNSQNVRALSGPECNLCKQYIAEIENRNAAGMHLDESFSWTLSDIRAGHPQGLENNAHLVILKYSLEPHRYLDSAGQVVESGEASAGNMAILVRWTGEGWVVDMGGPESDESYGSLLDHVEP